MHIYHSELGAIPPPFHVRTSSLEMPRIENDILIYQICKIIAQNLHTFRKEMLKLCNLFNYIRLAKLATLEQETLRLVQTFCFFDMLQLSAEGMF